MDFLLKPMWGEKSQNVNNLHGVVDFSTLRMMICFCSLSMVNYNDNGGEKFANILHIYMYVYTRYFSSVVFSSAKADE